MKRAQPTRASRTSGRSIPGSWLLLFLVALGLRAGSAWLAAGPGAAPSPESADLDAIAWNLASGRGFSAALPSETDVPTALRAPVVPWLTSLVYRATGHEYFGALLLQCLIGALIPIVLVHLGAAVFGSAVGWTAGWLAAIHPLFLLFSGDLWVEPAFAAALVTALLATVQWIKTPRPGRAMGVGIAFGVATLTHPAAGLLPVLVAIWAWVPLGLTVMPRDRVRQTIMLLLGTVLVVAPWTIRNALAFHAFIPVTTDVGRTFLFAHVGDWPALAATRLARFWSPTRGATASAIGDGPEWLAGLDPIPVWSLLVVPLALWGLFRIARGPRRWFQLLAGFVILYFSAQAVLFGGSPRARIPIEPMVVLIAAAGLEDVRRRLRVRATGLRVVERAR